MIIDPASYIGGGVLYYTNYDICTLGEVVLFSMYRYSSDIWLSVMISQVTSMKIDDSLTIPLIRVTIL